MTTSKPSAEQRSIVVTGASSGIGEACALDLDRRGLRVFAGVRKESDADALRAKASARLTPVRIDVQDAASIAAARDEVAQHLGGAASLAGLVNNAGIALAGPIELVPLDDLRRQLEINVIGQVAVTQAFLPMLRNGRGRIVNIGSIGGRMASPLLGPYNASKYAMEAITDCLRMELRPWGMHVSIVEPGSIATNIWEKSTAEADEMERNLSPEGRELYAPLIAAVRGLAKDIAERAIPADVVAKAVAHALLAKRPKTRYLVGRDARIQATIKSAMPDQVMDRLIVRQLGL